MIIRSLPFYRRVAATPIFPAWTSFPPARLDIEVCMDNAGMVMQRTTPVIVDALAATYGQQRDNFSMRADRTDNTNYYLEFWTFLQTAWGYNREQPKAAVDVGCGDGFLVKWLKQWCKYAVGLERHIPMNGDTDILQLQLNQIDKHSFDLVVHHHVLEHVLDPLTFLMEQREALTDDGLLVFAVPNCTDAIAAGDPSMLLHQHISYFGNGNLVYLLQAAGFQITFIYETASEIFLAARPRPDDGTTLAAPASVQPWIWETKCEQNLRKFASTWCAAPQGEIGVYCPLRAAPYLASVMALDTPRLFDDGLQRHYIDGFRQPIEGIEDLVRDPPRNLFIMSLTHGDAIADKVETQLEAAGHAADACNVITLADLLEGATKDATVIA